MPFLDKITTAINEALVSSLSEKRFALSQYLGIATVLARPKGSGVEFLPAVVDLSGEYKLVEPSDKYGLQVYHRTISNTYSRAKKSYGDEYNYSALSEMSMVVIADSRKLKMQATELEPLIIYGLPQRLPASLMSETGFATCLITPLSSNMDKVAVFRQEYPGTDYFLKPFQQLFSIRYRIESSFDKNCVNQCLCGE